MKMLRHYFISDDLDDLEVFEEQLEAAGVDNAQIHVLSNHEADVEQHNHLHQVKSFAKRDIVHSTLLGAVVGVFASLMVLFIAKSAGWHETAAGWMPFIFLAVIMLGFCTWEGGLLGIQRVNHDFARFQKALAEDKHVFFVDLEPAQEAILDQLIKQHPTAKMAGTGHSMPHWLLMTQLGLRKVLRVWP